MSEGPFSHDAGHISFPACFFTLFYIVAAYSKSLLTSKAERYQLYRVQGYYLNNTSYDIWHNLMLSQNSISSQGKFTKLLQKQEGSVICPIRYLVNHFLLQSTARDQIEVISCYFYRSTPVPVKCNFVVTSPRFARFKNVLHTPSETPS